MRANVVSSFARQSTRIRSRISSFPHRRLLDALPDPGLQALFLHQPNHALAADALVLLEQVLVNPRAAVALVTGVERRVHEHRQPAVTRAMGPGYETVLVCVVG